MRIDRIDWIPDQRMSWIPRCSKVDDSPFSWSPLSPSPAPVRLLLLRIECLCRFDVRDFQTKCFVVVSQSVLTATSRNHSCLTQFKLYGLNYQSTPSVPQLRIHASAWMSTGSEGQWGSTDQQNDRKFRRPTFVEAGTQSSCRYLMDALWYEKQDLESEAVCCWKPVEMIQNQCCHRCELYSVCTSENY